MQQELAEILAEAISRDEHVLLMTRSSRSGLEAARLIHRLGARARAPLVVIDARPLARLTAEAELSEALAPSLAEAEGGHLVVEHLDDCPGPCQVALSALVRGRASGARLIFTAEWGGRVAPEMLSGILTVHVSR